MTHTRIFIAAALLTATLLGPARAAENEIPLDMQAAIFSKVIAYDQSTMAREGELVLGIVLDAGTAGRESMIALEFGKLEGRQIGDKTLGQITFIDGSDTGALATLLAESGAHILYMPHGTDKATAKAVTAYAVEHQLLTLGASRDLAKRGAAISLAVQKERITIILNRKAAKAQGVQVTDEMLKISKTIR